MSDQKRREVKALLVRPRPHALLKGLVGSKKHKFIEFKIMGGKEIHNSRVLCTIIWMIMNIRTLNTLHKKLPVYEYTEVYVDQNALFSLC